MLRKLVNIRNVTYVKYNTVSDETEPTSFNPKFDLFRTKPFLCLNLNKPQPFDNVNEKKLQKS